MPEGQNLRKIRQKVMLRKRFAKSCKSCGNGGPNNSRIFLHFRRISLKIVDLFWTNKSLELQLDICSLMEVQYSLKEIQVSLKEVLGSLREVDGGLKVVQFIKLSAVVR